MTKTKSDIRAAVRYMLRVECWPEYEMADDRGLDEDEYVEFVIGVLTQLEDFVDD